MLEHVCIMSWVPVLPPYVRYMYATGCGVTSKERTASEFVDLHIVPACCGVESGQAAHGSCSYDYGGLWHGVEMGGLLMEPGGTAGVCSWVSTYG